MKTRNAFWLTILTTTVLAIGGCGGGGETAEDAAPTTSAENPAQDATGPVHYNSAEGRFDIVWPSGCARVKSRVYPVDEAVDPDVYARQRYFCDREGFPNEGCAIGIQQLTNLPSSAEATPEMVFESIKSVMTAYRVDILRQSPIVRGELEGVGLHCISVDGGPGTVWIEGFIWRGDIYVLTAWSENREIFGLEEFRTFFTSFNPWPPDAGDEQ